MLQLDSLPNSQGLERCALVCPPCTPMQLCSMHENLQHGTHFVLIFGMLVWTQAGHLQYSSQVPGYEALGCVAPPGSAFVVRADALQKCNWLPTHSRAAHVALGQELKLQGFLSHYVPDVLATGQHALLSFTFCTHVLYHLSSDHL